ncbi:MAG: hypothetical protein IJ654_04835 [Bacteroidales bacterium]|nr:hypothetical protein [Bacteroidales bacterium]
MKKAFPLPLLLTAVLLLGSCTHQGPALFRGYYSFKTGGSIDITGTAYELRRDTIQTDTIVNAVTIAGITFQDTSYRYHIRTDTLGSRDTSFSRHLMPESGQMHILGDDGQAMKVTFNVTGGDPVVFDATAEGALLRLSPVRRMVPVRREYTDTPAWSDLSVSGTGHRYENMILLDLLYEGEFHTDGIDGTVTGSRISCIATENE